MIHAPTIITYIMMVLTGIIVGDWLGNHGNWLTDFIAGLFGLFIILCVLVEFKVF